MQRCGDGLAAADAAARRTLRCTLRAAFVCDQSAAASEAEVCCQPHHRKRYVINIFRIRVLADRKGHSHSFGEKMGTLVVCASTIDRSHPPPTSRPHHTHHTPSHLYGELLIVRRSRETPVEEAPQGGQGAWGRSLQRSSGHGPRAREPSERHVCTRVCLGDVLEYRCGMVMRFTIV